MYYFHALSTRVNTMFNLHTAASYRDRELLEARVAREAVKQPGAVARVDPVAAE